jgi:hypothetical protein
VRFNVKHQTVEQNQALLDMWAAVSSQHWAAQRAALGLSGLLSEASPVGIMVRWLSYGGGGGARLRWRAATRAPAAAR